jgi:RNA recognition motif-containing protein
MNIYVGNLPFRMSDQDLTELFAEYGEVVSARIIKDRETGRSKGFGFVEMDDDSLANEAISSLDGAAVQGRNIRVNEARPRD